MSKQPNTEKSIFLEAARIDSEAERQSYLSRVCGDDQALRSGVEALLAAHGKTGDLLDLPETHALAATGSGLGGIEEVGSRIGPYKLMEQIGEGGMGVVYVAEQQEPVTRRVALKVIKLGMDCKEVLARFAAERQALAMMDHSNIARVLDAGTTDSGRPFFVMELVRGVPITEFCDNKKLKAKERLRLFVDVCHAIQHAHQKGVIHRDIKPGNVLVTSQDGKPLVKVIDFGVAKAINQQLTEETVYTHFSQMVGTPLYMSPEQAEMSAQDVDTRSDIYSLGVLLYELLTGSPTIDKQRLRQAAYDEMRRIIREEEPTKPSSKISTLADAGTSMSADRGTDPRKLSQLLRGDLDWIVMKSLEKDRQRRYETANEFAMDVVRYLSGEAVEAAPPSLNYRVRKFVRRYKVPVLAASLLLFVLAAGVVGTTWGLIEARRQERIAMDEASEKERARQAEAQRAEGERLAKLDAEAQKKKALQAAATAKTANEQAQKRLGQIEKINVILGSIFESLDPNEIASAERPLQAILVDKLSLAIEQLEGEAIGDPLMVADIQNSLGVSLWNLGAPRKATVVFERALATRQAKLEPGHPKTLNSMNNLASAYKDAGDVDKSLPLFEEALELRKAILGVEHADTLTSMNNLAGAYQASGETHKALPLFEETLRLKNAAFGRGHPDTLNTMNNFAFAYKTAGELDLALPLFEETLKQMRVKLGLKHPHTLATMNNLAGAYQAAGKQDQALVLYEEALKLSKATFGPEHPHTLNSMNSLALAHKVAGRLDLALPLYEETLRLQKVVLGPARPDTLNTMRNLAGAYEAARKLGRALPLYEETLQLMKAELGPDDPRTLSTMHDLAAAYEVAGKLDHALPLFKETLKLRKAKLGAKHPDTLSTMGFLAGAYKEAGQMDLALPLLEETLRLKKAELGPDHPDTLVQMNNLAVAYYAAGKRDQTLAILEEALKLMKAKLGVEHPNTLRSMLNLAGIYSVSEDLPKALPLYRETWELMKAELGPDHPDTIVAINHLVRAYLQAGNTDLALQVSRQGSPAKVRASLLALVSASLLKQEEYEEAEPIAREALVIRERTQPDSWLTFNTHSLLGEALLGQKKYADAEPLLRSGYEGMKRREETISPGRKGKLSVALKRLIRFYEDTDNPEESKKWRVELELRELAATEDSN